MKFFHLFLFLTFVFNGFSQVEENLESCEVEVSKHLIKSNDDKINVEIDCVISTFSFKLFNRWGQILFESDGYSIPLDFDIHERMKGKRKKSGPEKYNEGMYYWMLEYTNAETEKKGIASGYLDIIE